MKRYILMSILLLFSINSFSVSGAFTTLMVEAKDIDRYVDVLKNSNEIFEAIGSQQAGVCITRSGNSYPGQMFVYNAFNSLEEAMAVSELYDPYKAPVSLNRLREIKYSATFKPLVEFEARDGFHQLFMLKLNNPIAFAGKMKELQNAINDDGHDIMIGVFATIAGGPIETGLSHLRMITDTGANMGKILDKYFDNASWSQIWFDAQEYVDEDVNETIEFCETIYTK